MSKIIAIGGGNIAEGDTLAIDEYIVQSAHKENPKLLFLPTACEDNCEYISNVKIVFEDLGCTVTPLCLVSTMLSKKKIEEAVFSSDIIYVGGGDTKLMLKTWKTYGVDKMLIDAYQRGIVLAGLSAGAICWFKGGYSSPGIGEENQPNTFVEGLGLIPYIVCPHYENERRKKFDFELEAMPYPGIALESSTAFVYDGEKYECIRTDYKRNIYKIFNNKKQRLKIRYI
ncbi:MAG: peptidase E [Bacilli bacterium]